MSPQPDDNAVLARRSFAGLAALAPLTLAAACASAPGAAGAPSELADAVEAYDRATIGKDIAALAELVADDYVLVNSDASVQNKQEYLADFNLPGFDIEPYAMQQPLWKIWGDAALTGGLLRLNWTQDGARHTRLLRIAHVWVRRGGAWRLAFTQLTRAPQAP